MRHYSRRMKYFTSFLRPSLGILAFAAASSVSACGSDNSPATSTAAAVAGPADTHCTVNGVEIKQEIGMCVVPEAGSTTSALSIYDAGAGAGAADAGGVDDAGADDAGADAGDNGGSDFGATLYNAEGDDDDCKYHVSWTSTVVKENAGVTFDVKVIRRIDGKPATGANVQIEAYLTSSQPTPTVDIPSKELGGGAYRVGPVVFDHAGTWTVRFHVYETCTDAPDSPHGHAAFFVNVP
jgi:hypothetical protein